MPQPAHTPKTVALATPVEWVREGFTVALRAAGHRVIGVATRDDLWTQLRSRPDGIDLLAIDLSLEGIGVDGVRTIRTAAPRTPIVVFGGSVRDAQQVRALAALGVTSYINEHSAAGHIVPALAPLLFPDNFDRRTSARVTLDIAVSYRVGEAFATALTLDVSKGGLGVRTITPLEPGTKVLTRFRLPGAAREIEASSRVAWRDNRTGMGLQFEDVQTPDQAAIDEFVDRHVPVVPGASAAGAKRGSTSG